MIFRELPIISPFPDIDTVKTLSSGYVSITEYKPLFYDIETTGLSAATSYCYLIGCITYETIPDNHQKSEDSSCADNIVLSGKWILRQWLAENPEEEPEILKAFSEFTHQFNYTIQYNGNKFDLPYLIARCKLHDIDMPISQMPALDLFQELKPCKKFLKFDHMTQPDLECFLGINNRLFADGRTCIKCYKEFLKKKDSAPLQEVLGHNLEDLCGLGQIFTMLSYRTLLNADYKISKCIWNESDFIVHFQLPFPVPVPFSYNGSGTHFATVTDSVCQSASSGIYLTGSKAEMKLLVSSNNGKLKMYYSNYKDYAYLPAEDTAIPKSLSSYIDKSLKKPARPETCYTWFEVNERFLNDYGQIHKYLQHLLEFFLNQ